MRIYISFFVVLLITSSNLTAQKFDQDSIYVNAHWKKGDKKSYKTIKTKFASTDSVISKNEVKHVFVSFEVLDSTAENFIIKYSKDSLKIPGVDLTGINKQVNDIINNISYKFQTDSYGEYIELINWENVRDNSLKSIDNLILSLEDKVEKEKYTKIRKGMENAFKNKNMIEHFMLKDIGSIFYNYGYVYAINDTLIFEEELPVPIGQGTIPAKGIFLVKYDKTDNMVTFETTTTIDSDVGKKYITNVLKSMVENMEMNDQENSIEEVFKNSELEILIQSEVKYDLETGWMKESYSLRKMILNDSKEVTTTMEEVKMTQM
jgi:hypothetical protein